MLFERKITLGSSRRKSNFSKKKALYLVIFAILVFLSIWQMPIKQNKVSENIALPKPTEIK
ncbi:MAG: hypothetical protein IJ638_01515 [Alphaproteobacteria bacterium]|nr:hypothetical protein [Alphaproteobacteria bacterium]